MGRGGSGGILVREILLSMLDAGICETPQLEVEQPAVLIDMLYASNESRDSDSAF